MTREIGLKCIASAGQFADEVAIKGADFSGEAFSFFANRKFVELDGDVEIGGEVPALLAVVPLAKEGDLVLIQLPGQTFGNGCTITVKEVDLEQRSASLL